MEGLRKGFKIHDRLHSIFFSENTTLENLANTGLNGYFFANKFNAIGTDTQASDKATSEILQDCENTYL